MAQTEERWEGIPGWDSYEASNRGQVRSVPRLLSNGRRHGGTLLRQRPDRKGYPTVTLTQGRRRRTVRVHVLVMLAFEGPPPAGKPQVRHLSGVNTDNRWPQNLAYGTQQENEADKVSPTARKSRSRRRREGLNISHKKTERGFEKGNSYRALAPAASLVSAAPHETLPPADSYVFPQVATGRATGPATGLPQVLGVDKGQVVTVSGSPHISVSMGTGAGKGGGRRG